MKKILLLVVGLIICGSLYCRAEDAIILDFNDPTLQMVLDGGARPTWIQGLEDYQLETGDVTARIFSPNRNPISIKLQSIHVEILTDYRISYFSAVGESQPFSVTASKFRDICRAWNLSTEEFDEGIKDEKTGRHFSQGFFDGDIHMAVEFRPVWNLDGTMNAYLIVGEAPRISLGDLAHHTWKSPIQPPPGYESISFDRPKPAVEPQETNAEVAASAKSISPPEQIGLQKSPSPNPSLAEVKPSPVSRVEWPIIIGLVVLVGGIIAWLKLKR